MKDVKDLQENIEKELESLDEKKYKTLTSNINLNE